MWQEIQRTIIFDDTWVMSSQWLLVSQPFPSMASWSFGDISCWFFSQFNTFKKKKLLIFVVFFFLGQSLFLYQSLLLLLLFYRNMMFDILKISKDLVFGTLILFWLGKERRSRSRSLRIHFFIHEV